MVWHPSVVHLPRSIGAAPVPDLDGLRRAALQASWRRDRRVAQRRMAFRWIAWYALRGLPLLAIAVAMGLWVLPHLAGSALAPANTPVRQASTNAGASVAPATVAAPPNPATPDLQRGEPRLELKLGSPFQPTPPATGESAANMPSASVPAAGTAVSATDSPSPQLKPDNWLHSQEP